SITFAAGANNTAQKLLLIDGLGLGGNDVTELSTRLGIAMKSATASAAIGVDAPNQFAPAVSLALAGAKPQLLPLDFSHSRLAPIDQRFIGRRGAWGIAIVAAALIALVVMFISNSHKQSELNTMNKQLSDLKPQIDAAQATVDRLKYGRGFFDLR